MSWSRSDDAIILHANSLLHQTQCLQVFKKKFSCGCAVVKGEAGKPDAIEIQVALGQGREMRRLPCEAYYADESVITP